MTPLLGGKALWWADHTVVEEEAIITIRTELCIALQCEGHKAEFYKPQAASVDTIYVALHPRGSSSNRSVWQGSFVHTLNSQVGLVHCASQIHMQFGPDLLTHEAERHQT